MNVLTRMRLFQKAAVAIFIVYMSTMLFVAVTSFLRKSGNTKMDMSLMQKVRVEAAAEKVHP